MTMSAIRKINVHVMRAAPRINPNFSFMFILESGTRAGVRDCR